ncbi:MAG TPA: type II secretion system protein GspM [Longimicrobium sp.]|nr:type II secretion system protein GspM [Longimicrobium sp.]
MITPREKRTLAAGALAVALLVGVGRGLPAWREWKDAAVARARLQTERAADAEASVRGLRTRIDTVEARQRRLAELAPALLDGTTPAASGASLSALLSGAAARAGVRLNSVQVIPDSAAEGATFVRIALHADATGDIAGVTRMLSLLEGGPELLAIRQLSITQPDLAGQGPEQLHAELTVEGLALAGGALPGVAAEPAAGEEDDASAGEDEDGITDEAAAGEAGGEP